MFRFIMEAVKGKKVGCDVCGGHEELVAKVEPQLWGLWLQELCGTEQKCAEKDGFADY